MAKRGTVCILCGEEKKFNQLAKHRNENLDSQFGFCKECLNLCGNEDEDTIIDVMRLMNMPFVNEVWENAVEIGADTIFTKYIQLIATQRKYQGFLDSTIFFEEDNEAINQLMVDEDFEVTNEVIARWGKRDNDAEYMELEMAYREHCNIKEPATLIDKKRYIQNVKLGKALDIALETGDVRQVPSLRTAYTKDLEELGLNIDMTGQDEGLSLGMRIQKWEQNAPVPTSEEFKDVDGVKGYISKWFTIQMKRVFGMASEEEISELYD